MINKKFLKFLILFLSLNNLNVDIALSDTNNSSSLKEFDSQKKETILIELNNLKNILINNSERLKVIKSQIDQSENILKSKISSWSPRFTIKSSQLPKYTTGETKNKLSNNTSSKQLKIGIDTLLEWDLINPSRRVDIKIAKNQLKNLKLFYEVALNDLFLEAVNIYYAIKASSQEIKVAKQAIKISLISLDESENKFNAGIGNKLDVLEANTQLNRNEIKLLEARNKLNKNINLLSEILNIKNNFSISKKENFIIDKYWNISRDDSLNAAFKNRLDLKIKSRDIDINKLESQSIISNKKPIITLYNNFSISSARGELGVDTPDFNNYIQNNTNTLGMKFNWNVFDGGRIKQNYLSSLNKSQELISDLNLKKININKEIDDSLNNYEISKDKIIYSYKQYKAAEESLKISLKRLEAGITTQREIVNMQGDLIESETNFINSIKEYNINIATLSRITSQNPNSLCEYKLENKIKSNIRFIEFLYDNKLVGKCGTKI